MEREEIRAILSHSSSFKFMFNVQRTGVGRIENDADILSVVFNA